MKQRLWVVVITVVSLSLLCSLSVPSVARAQQPGNICVLHITSNGNVLGVLVNAPQDFSIAVLIPSTKSTNVPVVCDLLSTIALAVANQEQHNTTVSLQVFTHDGALLCNLDPFTLPVNGGRAVDFADCK
jgi:hypothetical protein